MAFKKLGRRPRALTVLAFFHFRHFSTKNIFFVFLPFHKIFFMFFLLYKKYFLRSQFITNFFLNLFKVGRSALLRANITF